MLTGAGLWFGSLVTIAASVPRHAVKDTSFLSSGAFSMAHSRRVPPNLASITTGSPTPPPSTGIAERPGSCRPSGRLRVMPRVAGPAPKFHDEPDIPSDHGAHLSVRWLRERARIERRPDPKQLEAEQTKSD